MTSRRSLIAASLLGFLGSSCATTRRMPDLSFAQALQLLPSIRTASELVQAFGEPGGRMIFNPDEVRKDGGMNWFSRELWKRRVVEVPAGLIDTLPAGTAMLHYRFGWEYDVFSPSASTLFVCVDGNDQVVGWMYGSSLVGKEDKAKLWRPL